MKALGLDRTMHRSAFYLQKMFPQEWANYFSFAIVRNPWARVVSNYEYAKLTTSYWHNTEGSSIGGKHMDYDFIHDKTFKEVVTILGQDETLLKHPGWRNQYHYIYDGHKILVDKVFRQETINDEFAHQFKVELPVINTSSHRDYTHYYDDDMIEIVRRVYQQDIDIFNYEYR